MRVLITGANGQIGGALQRTAPAWAELSAIDVDDCDLTDVPMLRARLVVEAPNIILNASGYTAVDKAEDEEELARAINARAVEAMVEAMVDAGGKVVYISTDHVFDGTSARAYLPDDQRNPLSAYGRTKAEGEDMLRPEDLLVRTTWVYDAHGTNFVRTILGLMKEREEFEIVSDQIGSPTWATGLAKTIWALVEKGAAGTFHWRDAGAASWYDVAVAIAEEAHALGLLSQVPTIRPVSTTDDPAQARRPALSLLDCSATYTVLDETPAHWRNNLRLMLKSE